MPSRGPEIWPCANARKLAERVREAGGGILRKDDGKVEVDGPCGSVIVDEPKTCDDRRDERLAEIARKTGLKFS